jgi:hypothetical protein
VFVATLEELFCRLDVAFATLLLRFCELRRLKPCGFLGFLSFGMINITAIFKI